MNRIFRAAERQRACHLRHIDLAAHREADPAEACLEDRKFVPGHVLELPARPAGVDPGAVRVGPPVAGGLAPVRIGHDDEVVGGSLPPAGRRDRAEDGVNAVLGRGFGQRRSRIVGRGHAPGAGIGLGEADEGGAVGRGARDGAHGVGDIRLIFRRAVRQRLHDGDAKAAHTDDLGGRVRNAKRSYRGTAGEDNATFALGNRPEAA